MTILDIIIIIIIIQFSNSKHLISLTYLRYPIKEPDLTRFGLNVALHHADKNITPISYFCILLTTFTFYIPEATHSTVDFLANMTTHTTLGICNRVISAREKLAVCDVTNLPYTWK